MTEHLTIEEIDRDGAVREAAESVGETRAAVLRKGLLASGGLVAGGALLSAPVLAAAAPSVKQDVEILNYALTLEYLEAAFYAEALAKGKLTGRLKRFAQVAGAHEAAHVAFLKKALGNQAVAQPKFDFKGTTASPTTFGATAIALEDTGVSAYTGQVNRIKQGPILQAAAQVQAVEARHAAWVRHIVGRDPAPGSLNPKASMDQVLAVVKKTGFIVT